MMEEGIVNQGEDMQVHLIAVMRGHEQEVNHVRFSPDGTFLASADNKTIRFWSTVHHTPLQIITDTPFQIITDLELSRTPRIDISKDGKLLAVATSGKICLWTTMGHLAATMSDQRQNFSEAVFSPDGRFLVGGSTTGYVYIWEVKTKQLLSTFQGALERKVQSSSRFFQDASEFAFTRDGTRLAMVSRDERGMVQIWTIRDSGTGAEWIGSLIEPGYAICELAFSPDGSCLAVSDSHRDVVWLFDATSLQPLGELSTPDEDTPKSMAFSPDGRFLAIGGGVKGKVWIWNLMQQQIVTSFDAHTEGYAEGSELWTLGGIDWSPNGQYITTSGTSPGTFFDLKRIRYLGPDDFTVKLWEIQQEEQEI